MEMIAHVRTSSNDRRSHQYDTYNSISYVINYYYPYGYLQCYNNAVGEPNIIIALEVLYCKLKQLQPPAGGLFVFQSSVFRINEKRNFGKQGFALTKKREDPLIVILSFNIIYSIFLSSFCAQKCPFS